MSLETPPKSKIPFAEVQASSAFMAEAQRFLVREIMNRNGDFISERNHQIFYHGSDWSYQREEREGFTTQTGQLQHHQQTVSISVDRILNNEVSVLPEFILGFGEQTAVNMAEKLQSQLSTVAEETGNSTSVSQEESIMEAFLTALDRAQWSVNPAGQLYVPRIILDAKGRERLDREIAANLEEFKRRFAEIRATKEPLARQAEEERLKKYDA